MLKQISRFILFGLLATLFVSFTLLFTLHPAKSQSETTYGYGRGGIDDPLIIHTNPPTDQPCDERKDGSTDACQGTYFNYREGTFYSFTNSQDGVIEIPDGKNPTRGIFDDGEAVREITILWPELFAERFPDAGNEEVTPGDVEVTVSVRYDGAPEKGTFVTADTLTLKNNKGKTLKEVRTNSPELLSVPFNMVGEFKNISPGKYQACSALLKKCKEFELKTGDKRVFIGGTVSRDSIETVVDTESETDCQSTGSLGWILCGVIEFVEGTVNFAKNFIVSYLETKPLSSNDDLFNSWKGVRTLANVLLVPIFFAIIFSQALSLNIDAYTIKKMLPRLIAGTILIQFSFYIVAIMADITNVLGNGLGDLLVASVKNNDVLKVTANTGGGIIGGLTIAGVLLGTAVGVVTGFIFTLMIPLLLAVLGVLFTLVFRQVLIILLAILAPVAFIAWVLPNTEKLFKLWWSTLLKALMMYPMIVALFASGTILAAVLTNTDVNGTLKIDDDIVRNIAAIIAVIAPLALVPFTFKMAGGAMAGIYGSMDKLRKGVTHDKQGKPRRWYGDKLQRAGDRYRDLKLGKGAGWRNPVTGKEIRIGKGGIGQFASQPWRLTKGQRVKASLEGMGENIEMAEKRLKADGLDSLPAAELVIGGHARYTEKRKGLAKEVAAGRVSPQELSNLDALWSVAGKHANDGASILAASKTIAASKQGNIQHLQDLKTRFGGHPLGTKAWGEIALGGIEKNPYLRGIHYESGKIEKGAAAKSVAGANIDALTGMSLEQMAHALRDKYDYDNGGNNYLSDSRINQILVSDRTPDAMKKLIQDAQTHHGAGGKVEGIFNDKAYQNQVGLKGPLVPPST